MEERTRDEIIEEILEEAEEYEKELDTEIETEITEPKKEIFGTVGGCYKLNVRKESSIEADIIAVIDCLAEVMIDDEETVNGFYKIHTASGIEGFCMKDYITIH